MNNLQDEIERLKKSPHYEDSSVDYRPPLNPFEVIMGANLCTMNGLHSNVH